MINAHRMVYIPADVCLCNDLDAGRVLLAGIVSSQQTGIPKVWLRTFLLPPVRVDIMNSDKSPSPSVVMCFLAFNLCRGYFSQV
jgi:hypothetical protein